MSRTKRVLVVGAGIGGLAAACALHRHSFEVEVYERAAELGEVGAGLQLAPNAVKVLRGLGMEEGLRHIAAEPPGFVSIDGRQGRLRYREPMKEVYAVRYGAPYLMAHRADLHQLLARGIPESRIHLGANCTGASTTTEGCVARFADGREVEADIVVGADGIRSVVREGLFGAGQPRFTRQMCWRGIIPVERVPRVVRPEGSLTIDPLEYVGWIGPEGHVICYPIRRGELYNIFAGHVSDAWVEESWTVPSNRGEMLEGYAGWNETLLEMLGNIEHCFKWGIRDRDPLASWTKGRVTLLGDAAHPMMPTLAQGAAIALEDGYALARCLAAHRADSSRGLAAYDAERVPRASRVQLQARQQFENNQKVPPPPPLERDWIYEHDATRGGEV